MADKNVQGVPSSSHDVPHDRGGAKNVPDPSKLPQGTKPPELRDEGDKR